MLQDPVIRSSDAVSTVTELISNTGPKRPKNRGQAATYISGTFPINRTKNLSSSTRLLKNYIKEYDKSQAQDLAEALTYHVQVKPAFDEDKEIAKEISYARSLLGSTEGGVAEEDLQSLTTDDLLTMDPCTMTDTGMVANSRASSHSNHRKHKTTNSTSARKKLPSSRKSESSNSMRFSEIASQNFYSRTLTETTSTDSNLFSLNGVNYTPHSVKYKSVFDESDSVSKKTQITPKIEFSDSNFDTSCDTLTQSPERCRLTADAGRTPYKSWGLTKSMSCVSDGQSFQNAAEVQSSPQSEFSSASHYSVPIRLNAETPEMQEFMRNCLEENCEKSDLPPAASGSVETLKNMLFTLQSIASTDSSSPRNADDFSVDSGSPETTEGPVSLKKAISHLANLKDLLA